MGFGHRVYKNYDPRTTVMRETCHEVLKELGAKDDLLEVAMELEKHRAEQPVLSREETVPERHFFSGIILKAMGIPIPCSPSFSQWHVPLAGSPTGAKMHSDGMKYRPRQLYTDMKNATLKAISSVNG